MNIDWERLAKHYIWESLVRWAGASIPPAVLRRVAEATANEVPAIVDPVGAMEWHIERILTIARAAVATHAIEQSGWPPKLGYTEDMGAVTHTWGPGESRLCVTTLPSAVCGCGRYALVAVDAQTPA